MKNILPLLYVVLLFAACQNPTPTSPPNGWDLLHQANQFHDPQTQWPKAKLNIHIQEPRLKNPSRYSLLELDNQRPYFQLIRNRDQHLSTHIIDEKGKSTVLLDGSATIDTALIRQYRLSPKRNTGYRNFYQLMYGLPMSLDSNHIASIDSVSTSNFNDHPCYRIAFQLKEAMISKQWVIYVSTSDYRVQGVEIIAQDDPAAGEILYFDQLFEHQGMRLPRVRHWLDRKEESYSGTDIILKKIE